MKFETEEELKLDKPLIHEVGLVEELEISITKNCELSVELEKKNKDFIAIEEKFKDLEFSKIAVEKDLKECKRTNDGLEERIIRLEEDKRDVCEREKRAQERILFLEKQINQFKTEIRDLENGKSRAENETEIWKKRCRELETPVLMTEEESSSLRCLESHVGGTGKKEMSENGWKKENMFADSNHRSPPHAGNIDVHVTGPLTIDRQHEPSINTREHKKNTDFGSNVEVENKTRKKIDFEIEERKIALLGLDSVKSAGIVEISDSEADQRGEEYDVRCEADIIPLSSTPKRKRCSKIVFTDSESEEDDSIPIGKLKMMKMELLTGNPTPKLCPLSPCTADTAVSSEGKNVEESITPLRRSRRLSLRQCEEKKSQVDETPNFENTSPDNIITGAASQEKVCNLIAESDEVKVTEEASSESADAAVSSEGENVEESITPLRRSRRLMSVRQCEKKKSQVDETPNFENTSSDNVKTGAASQEKVCNLITESDEEKVTEEASSESEGDSLGGFIVDDCESSDSGNSLRDAEDSVDSDLDHDQIMATIERRKNKKIKWQFEGDMLSSFGKDPSLCMKAVCALYRQQTAEEKSFKGSLHLNKRGFSKLDALRGTYLAEFLTDGSEEGDLVKSVEELEAFDPEGVEVCRTLACRYSKQLFTIYQNQEDPLFGPS